MSFSTYTQILAFLVILGGVLGIETKVPIPDRVEGGVSLQWALTQTDPFWVDARSQEQRNTQGSWQGAFHLTQDNWNTEFLGLLATWDPAQPIFVFCNQNYSTLSKELTEALKEHLGPNAEVYWLIDGWTAIDSWN